MKRTNDWKEALRMQNLKKRKQKRQRINNESIFKQLNRPDVNKVYHIYCNKFNISNVRGTM